MAVTTTLSAPAIQRVETEIGGGCAREDSSVSRALKFNQLAGEREDPSRHGHYRFDDQDCHACSGAAACSQFLPFDAGNDEAADVISSMHLTPPRQEDDRRQSAHGIYLPDSNQRCSTAKSPDVKRSLDGLGSNSLTEL